MAATLPTEITQSILLLLDAETFHNARQTCVSWSKAAFSSHVLRLQLLKTPISPPETMREDDDDGWWSQLFNQVARANNFGKRDHIDRRVRDRRRPRPAGIKAQRGGGVMVTSRDKKKIAVLKGTYLELHDAIDGSHAAVDVHLSRSLYPLWTAVARAMSDSTTAWMTMGQQHASYQVALSYTGDLIAVGLGSTIHMYVTGRLGEDEMPAAYVFGDNDRRRQASENEMEMDEVKGTIQSLEFAEHDTLLRVTVCHMGIARVLYLGNPSAQWSHASGSSVPSTIQYWKHNLNHVYLDSSRLSRLFSDNGKTRFTGFRLLIPDTHTVQNKSKQRLFAAGFQHGDESCYCIGSVSDGDQATVLTKLPARRHRLSEPWLKYFDPIDGSMHPEHSPEGGGPFLESDNIRFAKSRWDVSNMPAAASSQPLIAVSDDGILMAVYGPGEGHKFKFANGGAIYVYNIGCAPKISRTPSPDLVPGSIAPWPFLLDIIDDKPLSLQVRRERDSSGTQSQMVYIVSVETASEVIDWRIS